MEDYLSHDIRPQHLNYQNLTANAAAKRNHLTSEIELRSFLGVVEVICCFVPYSARFAAPRKGKLRNDQ